MPEPRQQWETGKHGGHTVWLSTRWWQQEARVAQEVEEEGFGNSTERGALCGPGLEEEQKAVVFELEAEDEPFLDLGIKVHGI
jgi:hypothetical protein